MSKSASNPSKETISRYEIISELGSGGMGVVYKAVDPYLKKTFAVKVVNALVVSDDIRIRFQKEAKALKDLKHPAIPEVYNFSITSDDEPYLVMEYVEGKSLFDVLSEGKLLSIEEVIGLIIEACDALGYAHRHGIIHRDLKPGNLILVDDAKEYSINVIDFGLAKLNQDADQEQDMTKTGIVIGSPPYMSPEQIQSEIIDQQSDIYSLGCVFYELLTGEKPFLEKTALATISKHVSTVAPRLEDKNREREFSEELEEVVATCLKKNKSDRFKTMDELKERLHKLVGPEYDLSEEGVAPEPEDSTANSITTKEQSGNYTELDPKSDSSSFKLVALALLVIIGLGCFVSLVVLKDESGETYNKQFKLRNNRYPGKGSEIQIANTAEMDKLVKDHYFGKNHYRITNKGKTLAVNEKFDDPSMVKLLKTNPKCKVWNLSDSQVTYRGLKLLQNQNVISLSLRSLKIGSEELSVVSKYKPLKFLFMINCHSIKNKDLEYLRNSKLKTFIITSNNVTPESCSTLKSMKDLVRLEIGDYELPAKSVYELAELPKLNQFGIRVGSLTDESARAIAEKLKIQKLRFVYCKNVQPSWFKELAKSKTIHTIYFDNITIPEGLLGNLAELAPLKRIVFYKCEYSAKDLDSLQKSKPSIEIETKI